jgi:hypothetical protein
MKYKFIDAPREQYTVTQRCEVFGVSRSASPVSGRNGTVND